MANTKISQLTANTNPSWSEEMVYASNNANGKITLDTMKWYVESNLNWYATTSDLTTWLAWKQDTLVSGTNIKTINGASVVWSWDIIVTWWTWYTAWTWIDITSWTISNTWVTSVNWQTGAVVVSGWGWDGWYDCIVASDWTWDYTNVYDALRASKCRIFVKNWTYTHLNQVWDCDYTSNDYLIEWESKKWVTINFESDTSTTSSSRYFIETRSSGSASGHSFLLKNMTINLTPAWWTAGDSWPKNALFYNNGTINWTNSWRVEDVNFNIDNTNWAATLAVGLNMGSWYQAWVETVNKHYWNWFHNCNITISWVNTYRVWLSAEPYWTASSWSVIFHSCCIDVNNSIPISLERCVLINCYVDAYDAWISGLMLRNTHIQCNNIFERYEALSVWWDNTTYFYLSELINSYLNASTTVRSADYIMVWDMVWSYLRIWCENNNIQQIRQDDPWENSTIYADDAWEEVWVQHRTTWCDIECNTIRIRTSDPITWTTLWYSNGWVNYANEWYNAVITWCELIWDWTVSWDDVYSDYGTTITWCRCWGAWQDITLDWAACSFTWNVSSNLHLTLWTNANKCIVSWNYINRFETTSWSSYCVIVWNAFSSSSHASWTWHVYANNID